MSDAKRTIQDWAAMKCQPTKKPMGAAELKAAMRVLPGWAKRGKAISKAFEFKNYYQTMAFVNAVAWVAHREDHHPDLEVGYNKCVVRYSTHSAGGISENDVISAAKVEGVISRRG